MFLGRARARGTPTLEATLNHPCPAQVQDLQVARRVEELTPRPDENRALVAMEARLAAMAEELRHAKEERQADDLGSLSREVRGLAATVDSLSPRGQARTVFSGDSIHEAIHEDPSIERLRRDVDRLRERPGGESQEKLATALSISVADKLDQRAATPRRQQDDLQRALVAQQDALKALTEEIRRGRADEGSSDELRSLRLRFDDLERESTRPNLRRTRARGT